MTMPRRTRDMPHDVVPIPDHPGYFATPNGNVYSNRRIYVHKLKEQTNPWGHRYVYVASKDDIRSRRKILHRLIALTFIPNPDNKPFINHINFDPSDNRITNLEWCTPRENANHSAKLGRLGKAKGEAIANSKLNREKVATIREQYRLGESQVDLGKAFNVCQSTIGRIINRDTWRSI